MTEHDRLIREAIALVVDVMPIVKVRSPARARRLARLVARMRKVSP